MAKYSFEFKKKIVLDYIAGKDSFNGLAKANGVADKEQVRKWVNNYQKFGDSGLMRLKKPKKYSFEYKLRVVELYLTSEVTYHALALQEGIHNPSQICKWVNDFQTVGPEALRPKKKERKESLNTFDKNKVTSTENIPDNVSAERIKQLEDELLKLRIENAYLKELRRLRLEEEALRKQQRELSTVSEENSN